MADDSALLFRIKADSSQARREVSGLRRSVKQELDGLTSGLTDSLGAFGRVTSGAGALGLAVGAAGGIAAVTAGALFTLAKNTAEAGSKIYDLSRNTGISAELLSSLKVAADQSGASIETMAAGIGRFNRLIGEAAKGSDEATASLKRFGIEPQEALNNSEAALAKVFKTINDLPPGIQRVVAAQTAFGRGGAELVSTIETVGGNLDDFIKKAKELGVVLDDGAARAADEFGDQLDLLSVRATGLAQQLGRQLIPAFNQLFGLLSSESQRSGSIVRSVFEGIGQTIQARIREVLVLAAAIKTAAVSGAALAVGGPVAAAGLGSSFSDNLRDMAASAYGGAAGGASASAKFFGGGAGGGKGRGGGSKRSVESNELEIARREDARIYEQAVADAKRSFDQRESDYEEFVAASIAAENKRFEALRDGLLKERTALKTNGQELANDRREIDDKLAEAQQQRDARVLELEDEAREEQVKISLERVRAADAIADASAERRIAMIRAEMESRVDFYAEGEAAIGKLEQESLDRRIGLVSAELEEVKKGTAEQAKLSGVLTTLLEERAAKAEEVARRITEAERRQLEESVRLRREAQERGEIYQQDADEYSTDQKRRNPASGLSIFGSEFDAAREEGATKFEALGETIKSVMSGIGASMSNAKDMFGSFIGSTLSGVSSLVQNYVLLGEAGPKAFRKLVASSLSSVAAMAATQAVFSLGMGLASLTPWGAAIFGPAPPWFASAAVFGSIALGSGALGRVVAGDAFKNDARGPSGAPNQSRLAADDRGPRIVEESRARDSRELIVTLRTNDAYIVDAVERNVSNDGSLRGLIVQTAGA